MTTSGSNSAICVVHSVGVLEEPLTDCELSCSMERGVGFLGLSTSCTLIWICLILLALACMNPRSSFSYLLENRSVVLASRS
jgi:hypothetical protein